MAVFTVCGPLQLVTNSTSSTAYLTILGLLPTTITSNTYSARCLQKFRGESHLKCPVSCNLISWCGCTEGWRFRGLGWVGGRKQPRLGPDVQNLTFYIPFLAEKVKPSQTRYGKYQPKYLQYNKTKFVNLFECCHFSGQ